METNTPTHPGPAECTVVVDACGIICGSPAVDSFTTRSGTTLYECAAHHIAPSVPHSATGQLAITRSATGALTIKLPNGRTVRTTRGSRFLAVSGGSIDARPGPARIVAGSGNLEALRNRIRRDRLNVLMVIDTHKDEVIK